MEETLQTLGERMDRRFEHVDQRFASIDQRFASIDRRFEHVDQRFDELEQRIGKQIDDKVSGLGNKLLIELEIVQGSLKLVLERFDDFIKKDKTNLAEHQRIDQALMAQDLRIIALEEGTGRKAGNASVPRTRSGPALLNRKKRQK